MNANKVEKKNMKTETSQAKKNRHAEIERLFAEIEKLVAIGEFEKALDLRFEADGLRIYWKQTK